MARTANFHPQPALSKFPARRAPAYCTVDGKKGTLGNGFLEVVAGYEQKSTQTLVVRNKISSEEFRLEFEPFEAVLADGSTLEARCESHMFEARGSVDIASLRTKLISEHFDADMSYVLQRGQHFFSKHVVLHNVRRPLHIRKVVLYRHRLVSSGQLIQHDGGVYYPIMFVRGHRGSLFYSGDYPGYFADITGNEFSFYYYPGARLEPGRSFQTLTSHIGISCRAGRMRSNPYHESGATLDVGEQQWYREYLQIGTFPEDLPYLEVKAPSACCTGPSELEVIGQCEVLQARHVLLPTLLRAPDAYPLASAVRTRLRQSGLSATLVYRDEEPPDLRTVAVTESGKPADLGYSPCLASEDYVQTVLDRYLGLIERHHFGDVEVQGAPIIACHSTGHGHAPGVESIQKAFQGLVDIAAALRQECGHVRCSGPYGSYGAGITRLFDSVPLLACTHPLALPDIHIARLFADMGRLYFRRSHDFLVPKAKLTNFVGCAPEACPDAPYPGSENYPWYLYHDGAGWRYSLISAIGTGLRHRFNALPSDLSEADAAFARKWLRWEAEHLEDLMECEEVFDEPGLNAIDGYCYATTRGALLFAFNTSYDVQDVECALHLSHDSEYVLRELYPRELNYLGPHDGLYHRNSRFVLTLGPKEARVIEAVRRSPASVKRKRPEVFGAAWREEAGRLFVTGASGSRIRVGVRRLDQFEHVDVRLPGKPVVRTLTDWQYTERPLHEGANLLPQKDFSGRPWTTEMPRMRNVWLQASYHAPAELSSVVATTAFKLEKPCWAYPERLFFVVRFEPPPAFEPILTTSDVPGVPEAFRNPLPLKCGIDLASYNLEIRAWINGASCEVHPALACWNGYMPNPHPVVAYFFEAGSKLMFGKRNRVTLFVQNFESSSFRGIAIEHLPSLCVEKEILLRDVTSAVSRASDRSAS